MPRMSLIKCWASKDPKTSADGEETISATDTALVSFRKKFIKSMIFLGIETMG